MGVDAETNPGAGTLAIRPSATIEINGQRLTLHPKLAGTTRDILTSIEGGSLCPVARVRWECRPGSETTGWLPCIPGGTVISRDGQDVRWWTWAGFRANATLAATLSG
jgi:hypothetical protein